MADTNEMLPQAIAAARAGKTAEAKVLVDRILADDPNNPHALFLRGMLAKNQDEQRDYMEQVLSIDPEHSAAKKRMAQLEEQSEVEVPAEPVVEAAPVEEEVLAEPEAESPIDETVIAATLVADDVLDVGVEETVIDEVPELPEEGELAEEELIFPFEEEDEITFEEIEEAPSEGVAETLVAAAVADEVIEAADTPAEEDIPDWLFEEARSEEELLEIDETELWTEEAAAGDEELPDWLQEDTAVDYEDVRSEEELVFSPGDFEEDLFEAEPDESPVVEINEEDVVVAAAAAAPLVVDEVAADESQPDIEPVTEEKPAKKEAPKKKKSGRGLEILLVVLIIVAVIVVGVLAFLIINPPA